MTHERRAGAWPSIAVLAVRRKLKTDTPATSTGYCIARNSSALARSSTLISVDSCRRATPLPEVISAVGVTGQGVGHGGLTEPLAYDGVDFAGVDGEVDALEDFLSLWRSLTDADP